jgi:hypothetical protein
MRCVGRLRKRRLVWSVFPQLAQSLRRRPGGGSWVRVLALSLLFSEMCQGFVYIGIPHHLTIRSSRPRVVASAMCFTLRLHMSAAPPQDGLTQALGGEKRSVVVPLAPAIHRLRLAVLFGHIFGTLPLRPSPHGALRVCMRCVRRLRNLRFHSFGLSAPYAVTSDRSG